MSDIVTITSFRGVTVYGSFGCSEEEARKEAEAELERFRRLPEGPA